MSKGSDMSNRSNVVLIAEDDGELRELVCTELESEGFQVVSVTNGEEAISKTRSLKPDVIVMDLNMPVMNGIEAIKKLKTDHATSHIPIVVGTVVEEKEDITMCGASENHSQTRAARIRFSMPTAAITSMPFIPSC